MKETARKIIIVTQYYPPDMSGTGRVMRELAEDLDRAGFVVEVIAGNARYFNRQEYNDYVSSVPVRRIAHRRFDNGSMTGRLLNFISFPTSLLFRLHTFRKADKVILVSNPATMSVIGALISLVLKKPSFFILQDIYPDLAVHLKAVSQRSAYARILRKLNDWSFKNIKKIVVLSAPMRAHLVSEYGLDPNKVLTIPNWGDTAKLFPGPKDNPLSQVASYADKFVILYAGNIGASYDFMPILEAAEQLEQDSDVVFLIVGEGGNKRSLCDETKARGLRNVDFMSFVAEEDYNKLLACADCDIVIHGKGMDQFNFPGKVYSYMASGRPIIALCDKNSELAKLIAASQSGSAVETGRELSNLILKLKNDRALRDELGRNGRSYVIDNHSRAAAAELYVRMLSA